MNTINALLTGVALGATGMFAGMQIWSQIASDRAAQQRSMRRRLMGLEDRPERRPGAVGTARLRTASVESEVRGE